MESQAVSRRAGRQAGMQGACSHTCSQLSLGPAPPFGQLSPAPAAPRCPPQMHSTCRPAAVERVAGCLLALAILWMVAGGGEGGRCQHGSRSCGGRHTRLLQLPASTPSVRPRRLACTEASTRNVFRPIGGLRACPSSRPVAAGTAASTRRLSHHTTWLVMTIQ